MSQIKTIYGSFEWSHSKERCHHAEAIASVMEITVPIFRQFLLEDIIAITCSDEKWQIVLSMKKRELEKDLQIVFASSPPNSCQSQREVSVNVGLSVYRNGRTQAPPNPMSGRCAGGCFWSFRLCDKHLWRRLLCWQPNTFLFLIKEDERFGKSSVNKVMLH